MPAGLAAGDLLVLVLHTRSIAGSAAASAGWTSQIHAADTSGLMAVWTRIYQAGDAAPTVTLTGHVSGVAGDSAIARIFAFRGVDQTNPLAAINSPSSNASAQNIGAISGITVAPKNAVMVIGGKLDDWTSVALLTGDGLTWVEDTDTGNTSGSDNGLVVDHAISTSATSVAVAAKTFTVTGGTAQAGKGLMLTIQHAATAVALGRVTETAAPQIVKANREKPLGLVSTTAAPRAIAPSLGPLGTPIGRVTETATAQAIGRGKSKPLGLVTESDLAQAFGRAKAKALGLVTQASTALPIGRAKARAIGLVSTTALAQAIGRAKSKALGFVTDTAAPRPIAPSTAVLTRPIGRVTETDTAQAIGHARSKPLGLVTETDLARAFGHVRSVPIGLVLEINAARAITPPAPVLVLMGDVGSRSRAPHGAAAGGVMAEISSKAKAPDGTAAGARGYGG
jgi:hypothetical protein